MISILAPTRKRPVEFLRMVDSVRGTAHGPVDIVAYVDEDDLATKDEIWRLCSQIVVGPRIVMSNMWNKLVPVAQGDILMLGSDDMVMRTRGWDDMVYGAFTGFPDQILMVHGDSLGENREIFGPHPIVSRKWVDTLGYFTPPYFGCDFADTWINDIADALDRRVFLPFIVEHMHYIFGKATIDENTRERLVRGKEENSVAKYAELLPERLGAIEKLRGAICVGKS